MNILFLTHPFPNYIPDLLLHGLRKISETRVIDYPKKECLYSQPEEANCPEIYYDTNWFPEDNGDIDREDIESKLRTGFFEYLVCDVRASSKLKSLFQNLSGINIKIVLIDGEDYPVTVNPGSFVICRRETDGTDFSIPLPMAIPIEIFNRISAFDNNPKLYSVGFLGSSGKGSEARRSIIETIEKYYPDALLKTFPVASAIDENRPTERETLNDYYDKLQKCKVVLNLRGAGYDTFRFWENASCNAIHVSENMPLYIPDDFKNGKHIFRFSNIDELRKMIDIAITIEHKKDQIIADNRNHLLKYHLTSKRAEYFLDRVKKAFSK